MKFEIVVATFIVEHNLPLSITGPLVDLLKIVNPKIVARMHMGRQKCTNLIKKVIAPTYRGLVVESMKANPNSLLADKSEDVRAKVACGMRADASSRESCLFLVPTS